MIVDFGIDIPSRRPESVNRKTLIISTAYAEVDSVDGVYGHFVTPRNIRHLRTQSYPSLYVSIYTVNTVNTINSIDIYKEIWLTVALSVEGLRIAIPTLHCRLF